MRDQDKKFYSVHEVAEILGMAEVTIRTWLADRRLNYVKFGKTVRIAVAEIDRLVSEGTVPARRRQ